MVRGSSAVEQTLVSRPVAGSNPVPGEPIDSKRTQSLVTCCGVLWRGRGQNSSGSRARLGGASYLILEEFIHGLEKRRRLEKFARSDSPRRKACVLERCRRCAAKRGAVDNRAQGKPMKSLLNRFVR